jgi:hypothetical protein
MKYNQSLLIMTRYGVRYKLIESDRGPDQQGESHRDLVIATLGEVGIPLSSPIRVEQSNCSVRDLLMDSVCTFDIHEREIAWTAIAYALFIPPNTHWRTFDGQVFNFDALADELLRRPLNEASCGGVHLVMAMTILLRVDAQYPVLTASTRQTITERLRKYVARAIFAQGRDGSWTIGWDRQELSRPAALNTLPYKMLVTGHLLEWLEYLPPNLQPDLSVYDRAAKWISNSMLSFQSMDFESSQFCPWTHGVSALRNLISRN